MTTRDKGVHPDILDRHFGPAPQRNLTVQQRNQEARSQAQDFDEMMRAGKQAAIAFRQLKRELERRDYHRPVSSRRSTRA